MLFRSLLLPPSIFPSIRVFSNEPVLHIRWPKYWSFGFCICPFNEYSVLISFRIDCFDNFAVQGTLKSLLQHHSSKASILQHLASFMIDWLDLLEVQGTLKSLLQHHSSKASILWCSAFFIVQLSHLYMTTGKTIVDLTRQTLDSKVTSLFFYMLLFNMLSRLVKQSVCRSRSNSQNWTWNSGQVQNWERSKTRLYIVTLLNLTYTQSTSCEIQGWMNHKLEPRFPGEI